MTREVLDHGESACVLPYDVERRVALLVSQERVPQLYSVSMGHRSRRSPAAAGAG